MSCHRLPLSIWNALLILLFSVFGYASAPCPLSQTNPSVTVCTPAPFDKVQSPVHVVAGTTDSNPVTTMYVYVDSKLKYKVSASTLDTFLNLPIGHHWIIVQAKDSTSATFKTTLAVAMQPPCALNSANQSVTLCSMVNGSIVSSPFHVVAAATDSNPVTSMTLLIDGTNAGGVSNSAILDQYVSNVALGTHSITVQAQDSTATVFSTQFNIVVTAASNGLSKLRHIIFFVQENHTFDSYFGLLGPYKASLGLTNDVDGLDLNATQLTSQGQPVHPYHFQTICTDNLNGAWSFSHTDLDYGKMDGFVRAAAGMHSTIDPYGTRAMGYYDQSDIPYYYEAGARFAISDRFFSPVLTRTIPNRLYLLTGTSFGNTEPPVPPSGGFTQTTIFDHLDQAGVSWRYYYQGNKSSAFITQFTIYQKNSNSAQTKVVPIANWFNDVQNDSALPEVIFIERGSGLDEHPGNNVQKGAKDAVNIINGLVCPTHSSTGACVPSASWPDSALILTYDEGGAFYDHVLPAREVEPDSIQPILPRSGPPDSFNQSGFRVPVIVFSPWARPSFVSHTTRDYTSILRLIEDRFNVAPLTLRDANADNMMEFFDFSGAPPLLTPPTLPAQLVNGTCQTSMEAAPGY
ncbi:MAG: hypothetical protein JWN74_3853 [Acidobacteriaceae bacterium]|nr:hypothetical protein [Acidobacteriaceae bacterium]